MSLMSRPVRLQPTIQTRAINASAAGTAHDQSRPGVCRPRRTVREAIQISSSEFQIAEADCQPVSCQLYVVPRNGIRAKRVLRVKLAPKLQPPNPKNPNSTRTFHKSLGQSDCVSLETDHVFYIVCQKKYNKSTGQLKKIEGTKTNN